MKGTFIIIAFFVVIVAAKPDKGKELTHCRSGQRKGPVVIEYNRTSNFFGNSTILARRPSFPTVIRRRFHCLCRLPICVCSKFDNPEAWFVKTLFRDDAQSSMNQNVIFNNTKRKTCKGSRYKRPKGKHWKSEKKYQKRNFKFQCECSSCKLRSDGTCSVLLLCAGCGPTYINGTNEKINFSKLLLKMNNKLTVITKFLEIN